MIDYVGYIDTDSVFIKCGDFLKEQGLFEKFNSFSLEKKIDYLDRLSHVIKDYINERSFNETQQIHYNSIVDDFKIVFSPEKIAVTGLFTTKKRYATWTYLNEGKWYDKMTITGLEVNRSDSPEIVKPKIIHILELILKKCDDTTLKNVIKQYKTELYNTSPDEIAENKGVNGIEKYIIDKYTWKKGTPHHVKGVANFNFFLDKFGLSKKYETPRDSNKAKIVYLKPNKYNRECVSFYVYPEEFKKKGIEIDYEKMVYNNFLKKIENYLKHIGKLYLLTEDSFF
jgi:DNA polymerase elongation subunit (family B)